MTDASLKTSREFKGWHLLIWMGVFFGVMFAVNIVFVVSAVRSHPGEIVEKSYLQGLDYNTTLEARAAQSRLGWRAEAGLVERAGAPALVFRISDRDGQPISRLSVDAVLKSASDPALDRRLSLELVGPGEYVATVRDLAPGRWDASLQAFESGGEGPIFEANKSFFAP